MKKYKPVTPGRRQMTGIDYSVLSKVKPLKRLTLSIKEKAGRNREGRITVRHRGGGGKKKYRVIDFGQEKLGIPGKIISIEYDPNRTCFISQVQYQDGDVRYILTPQDVKVDDEIICDEKTELKPGNRMKLKNILTGTFVHNIELVPGRGGKLTRSAGDGAKILSSEGGYVTLILPSSEIRKVPEDSYATINFISNPEHNTIVIGKAGRNRWLRRRPHVRGSAMNPCDHPHGGGEGRASIGLKHPKTPWGKPALGVKTRKKGKYSDKFIVKRRKKKKRK